MINIRQEWFNLNKNQTTIIIQVDTLNILKNKNDVICYLLEHNLYPKFEPHLTYYSYILENENTGYLIICGNNRETNNYVKFKFVKFGYFKRI